MGLVAMQSSEGLGGRLAEQLLAIGLEAGHGRVDDLGFPAGDTEEFPLGIGDLLDEGILDGGAGREVDCSSVEQDLQLLEVLASGGDVQ